MTYKTDIQIALKVTELAQLKGMAKKKIRFEKIIWNITKNITQKKGLNKFKPYFANPKINFE